jgi:hypothetical protein
MRSAAMAAKKGAPVYSAHPPTTPIFPAWPLCLEGVRGGTMANTAGGSPAAARAAAAADVEAIVVVAYRRCRGCRCRVVATAGTATRLMAAFARKDAPDDADGLLLLL